MTIHFGHAKDLADLVRYIIKDRYDIVLWSVLQHADKVVAMWYPPHRMAVDLHTEQLPIERVNVARDARELAVVLWNWCKSWNAPPATRFRRFSFNGRRCV